MSRAADALYAAVDPDDFAAMLEIDRHLARSPAFDRFIAQTHDHFWDPHDPRHIDYSVPFDPDAQDMLPDRLVPALSTPTVARHFAGRPAERIRFKSQMARWQMSAILHGEQGALNLSASLCHIFRDPGAQEYAANQAREEARHVTAFAKYIQARWGAPLPAGPALTRLLCEIVQARAVYKKIVGMQMLVEGLAMGAFATIYREWADPLARRLVQLVMTDEAFHHKFGKIWADRTIPHLSADEQRAVEDWAAHCFQSLLYNLVAPHQMKPVYAAFGLDPDAVVAEFQRLARDPSEENPLRDSANLFRVLVRTLLAAGLISPRTAPYYAMYLDLEELEADGDPFPGEAIAAEGMAFLAEANLKAQSRAA